MPVAPIQQGKSYSDMVNEQVSLIQQQRSANLNQRLAQEEKNREFRQEQQQNIYDFDVSGLPQAYIEKISELQGQMASWLDPKADVHYEDSQQLTRDVAKLNNIYMSGKRLAAQGQPAMKGYEDGMLGKTKTPGVTSTATEETYKNRRAAYDQGGFGGMELVGGPGEVGLFGVPMVEGENGNWSAPEEGKQVDILSYQIDPFSLFRQEQIRDFINVEQKYVDEKDPDIAVLRAESDFNSNPESVQAEFRVKLANEDESWLERNDDGSFKRGTAELLDLYKAEAKSGWDKFHSTELPPSLLGGSNVVTEYGPATKLTDPKTGKDRTISLYTGGETRKVNHMGFRGQGENTEVFYVYQDPNDPNQYYEAVVPYDSAEGFSLINDAGAIGTIAKMVGMSVEDLENIEPVANSGDASTVNEGSDEEGGEGGEEEGEEDVVQASTGPAVNPIDNYKSAINSLLEANPLTGTTSGSGDFFRSDLGKFANRIKDMSIAQQATEVDKEIRRLNGVRSQERFNNPESYQRSQTWRNADKALKKLEEVQSMQEGLDTPENRDIAVEDIRTRIDEKKQELIESENISDRNSRNKTRDRINQEIVELEQGLEGLDLFANRESSSVGADLTIDPPTDPLPLLEAAPKNDWYNFNNISNKITEDQRSLIGYLVEEHGITPQAAVALTSVTAKESSGESDKKEGSYYATGKRPDGTEMNNLEQIKGIFKSSMGDNASKPLTQAELDKERSKGKESFDTWFFDRAYGPDTRQGKKLGNTEPGDGYNFRGRGLIQFTGRTNYAEASKFLFGDPDVLTNNPELLAEDPTLGARAAAWYLMRNGQIKNSDLANRANLSKEDALALADSSYAVVAGKPAFTPREELQQRTLYPSGSAGQRAWLNIN